MTTGSGGLKSDHVVYGCPLIRSVGEVEVRTSYVMIGNRPTHTTKYDKICDFGNFSKKILSRRYTLCILI